LPIVDPPAATSSPTQAPAPSASQAGIARASASFFASEIEIRRQAAYPPFVRLARLVYSHTNEEYGRRQAERLAHLLRLTAAEKGLPGVEVMGPAPTHVPKWHGRFRWQVTVRSPDPSELLLWLERPEAEGGVSGGHGLPQGWTLDIDPVTLA